MALPVWLDNLVAYSLQITILASAGTLLAYVFRLRVPRVSFVYWQVLLLLCLLLPALQNWKHPVYTQTPTISDAVFNEIPSESAVVRTKSSFSITPEIIGLAIVVGACLRMLRLAFGYYTLHRFLRHSQFLSEKPPIKGNLSSRIGAQARFFLSNEIDTPATFGLIAPTVILPASFPAMSEACRESIVCHELLHVRRRDWVAILVEEIIRSIYWFHPAAWWLLGRIHLAREQLVDHEVVRLTGNKQPYLESLLEIARSRGRPRAVPAPLFINERHLVQRVALLLREVSMNRLRLSVSVVGIAVLLAGTVLLAAGWFPLTGTPVVVQEDAADIKSSSSQGDPIGAGNKVMESKIIYRVDPEYPELAIRARVERNVIIKVTVNEEGFVSDAEVISGHPLLNDAAVRAVKQWRYRPTLLNGKAIPVMATVTVTFALENDKAETGSRLGVPPPPDKGDGIVGGVPGGIQGGIAGGVPGVVVAGKSRSDRSADVESKTPQRFPVRMGTSVMESKLIHRVDPEYPKLAMRARVEGNVILTVIVNEEGSVSDVQLVSGHPLLNDAAVAAVRQWKYRPTLLNGEAIPVMATVTVVFALK